MNAYHPFIKVSVEGVALIAGGLFSTYLGWALGMIFRGLKDQMSEKDSKLCSRVFMISFMGAGIILVASGVSEWSVELGQTWPWKGLLGMVNLVNICQCCSSAAFATVIGRFVSMGLA